MWVLLVFTTEEIYDGFTLGLSPGSSVWQPHFLQVTAFHQIKATPKWLLSASVESQMTLA